MNNNTQKIAIALWYECELQRKKTDRRIPFGIYTRQKKKV